MVLLATIAFPASAAEDRFFSVKNNPDYPQKLLRQLVDAKGHRRTNHFCILGFKFENDEHAWAFWTEENKLFQWVPMTPGSEMPLWAVHDYLDLKQDVVPEADDIGGSTYLVSQPWVDDLRRKCADHGDHFVIKR